MALINCPECGKQISDKAVSCPECGCPASEFHQSMRKDNRSEIDQIADDIFWRDPRFTWSNVTKVQKRTGLDKNKAKQIIDERVKEVKRGVDKRMCPACGSKDIVVNRTPDSTTTISFSEGIYHTQNNSGKVHGECLECGNKWKIKLI